ncbi:TPA: hypothetical protein ACH3X3_010687 [Trebouxia sp. C0006]
MDTLSPHEQKLHRTLIRELTKDELSNKVKHGARAPAKLRSLALDTHDSLPAYGAPKVRRAPHEHIPVTRRQLSRKQTTVALGPFGPEDPHQHDMSHANKLAQLAYSKRAHSEWSLLQKWEADVEKLSVQERKELLAKLKEEQRVVLDEQVLDKQKAKLQLQQDKVQDAQDLAATLKQHKIDEAKAAAARRSAALQTKALMAGQVAQYRSNKQEARRAKLAEEQAELDDMYKKQAEEDAKKAQQLHDDRIVMAKTLAENDANIKAKKKAAKQQALDDDEMMRQYAALLLRQDTAREAALLALQARTAMRAEVAGLEVKKARDEREAAENARIAAAVAEADRKAEEAAQKLAAMRRKMQQDCNKARQQQMQLKANRRAAEEQQDSDFINSLSAREAHLSKLEQAHQAAVKAHNNMIKMELERQIAEREESMVNEDTAMTAAERKINAPVLSKAIAASPACCVCGECADCCAWQQTRTKLGSSRRSR